MVRTTEPQDLTVVQLKAKLNKRALPTSGTKNELISRLHEADPSGSWLEASEDEQDVGESEEEMERVSRREMDILRRERELMQRELELMRRELELARRGNVEHPNEAPAERHVKTDIKVVSALIGTFDGEECFENWQRQLTLLRTTYGLDDRTTRVLIGTKLVGNAQRWFHCKSEHLELNTEELLETMKSMFHHQVSKLTRRRNLEGRKWKQSESFSEYFHDKSILANKVPVEMEELIECLIEGIPDTQLRNQARLHNFFSSTDILRAFEKIVLSRSNYSGKQATSTNGNNPRKEPNSQEKTIRCFNCRQEGHTKAECNQIKRGKPTCYTCGIEGHIARNCPENSEKKKSTERVNNVDSGDQPEDEVFKNIEYCMELNNNNDQREFYNVRLRTLIDSGSAVSFIKEKHVPIESMKVNSRASEDYRGINGINLIVLGYLHCELTFNEREFKNILFLVVQDYTMASPAVIGRDHFKTLGISVRYETQSDLEVNTIMNIDFSSDTDPTEMLRVNPLISVNKRNELRDIFRTEYVQRERPHEPKVKAELSLSLRDHKPFHFSPRRLSYVEKEQVSKILDGWMESGVIRPSKSEYASPIVLIRKKNGEIRLCVDYQVLNGYILRDNNPLPLIEDQLDALEGKTYFSVLDLKNGFHHIRVAEDSIKFTAFVTPHGEFEYYKGVFWASQK
ncbi:uncharacterized protein LOC106649699 [Trichogramma pretiosum]|uniref:uncharacterized protein LOC106649699 n=1 Tax=Trichogramma pretiosum TaxID=7493 RepID=UPI0006C9DAC6|nr:uncharacterized protein LOC106649699 [Trichogramma pretiosum]